MKQRGGRDSIGESAPSDETLSEATRSANQERTALTQEKVQIERRVAELQQEMADAARRAGEQGKELRDVGEDLESRLAKAEQAAEEVRGTAAGEEDASGEERGRGCRVRVAFVGRDGRVLLGPGHPDDGKSAGRVVVAQRAPQPGRLGQQFHADVVFERLVAGDADIADHRGGDSSADMERGRAGGPVPPAF